MITIRPEQPQDISTITDLLKQAFANHPYSNNNEYLLVEKLRNTNALTLALVAIIDEKIVGHLAFSPITINGHNSNWLGIGPLAVLPEYQKQGIGTALMEFALTQVKDQGIDGCVLVGFPDYYHRFGFKPAEPLFYIGVEAQYFMALTFKDEPTPAGEVRFHPVFDQFAEH